MCIKHKTKTVPERKCEICGKMGNVDTLIRKAESRHKVYYEGRGICEKCCNTLYEEHIIKAEDFGC